MEYVGPMLVVRDMEKSKAFYQQVLGLQVLSDLGANVVMTGGVSLQTLPYYEEFLGLAEKDFQFGGNVFELYFEEDDFDGFAKKLESMDVSCVHPVFEQNWGQRTVRFYDPDRHIIEVGENTKVVCRRFLDSGMTEEQAAERMDVPLSYIQAMLR